MNRYLKSAVSVIMGTAFLAVLISSVFGGVNDEKLPKMYIHKTEVDVGELYEGTDIEHTFTVRNNGSGELEVSVRPG